MPTEVKQEVKQYAGFLNSDDSNEVIAPVHHKMALNGRFRGLDKNMRFESVEGTTILSNPYLPAGINECIGAIFDELNGLIYSFNFNSNSNHAIYQYSLATGLWLRVIQVGYNTNGDILGFTLNGKIYAAKILYGDTTQGDTIYFNNSQKEPCQVNVKKALAGTYGTIKRTYIDVIKAIPILPPALTYEDDNTVTVNNLRKKLFKFKVRYIYINNNKSLWSSQGILPLPVNYLDTSIDKDPTKNSRIAIVVPTGEGDVLKIEIAAAISDGNVFGDYFSIAVLDKSALSINSNDIYTLRFYNNQAYTPIDVEESIQLFDLVPLNANALEFLNGNVPIYGGITEGYDITTVTATATSSSEAEQTTQPKYIFVVNQSGDSGFGTGNIHVVVIGTITVGDTFVFVTTNQTITFVAAATTTASIIAGLSAAAVIAGFTIISSDTENLVVIKTGEVLLRSTITPIKISVTDSFVYDRNSRYNFVLSYFDAAGRTIGSLTNTGMNLQTINYTETATVPNIPLLLLSISSRPPLYAKYFQIGRTKNLSKLTKLEWVSDRTYKDTEFAYISIENLNTFILKNPSSNFLAYSFSPNDRIRFMKQLISGGGGAVYTTQDFDIQSQVINPTISGVTYSGQFIKIALPTTSATFDFGTSAFFNYFIELYTPAQSISGGLDVDYEFGERYSIGNAGMATAYHQGMLQNQTADLVTPATFQFSQGDFYCRPRAINTGVELDYSMITGERGEARFTLGVNYVSSTYTDTNILTGSSPLLSLSGFDITTNNDRWLIKMVAGISTFRLKGSINVTLSDAAQSFRFYLESNIGTVTTLVPTQDLSVGNHIFSFDVTFTLAATERIFAFGYSDADFTNSKTFFATDWTITRQNIFNVNVIDPNFSDFFQSAVNSNGRTTIVDPNAAQVFNPTLLRWGLAYQPDTNINQANRFKPLNFDELPRDLGQIQILNVQGMELEIFQQSGVGRKGIYGKFVQDNKSTNILTTTDDIITKTNIDYYKNRHGIGNQPTSFTKSKRARYFIDDITGEQIRLSNDGLISISMENKGQFYIKSLLVPYNNDYIRPNGSIARVIQFYDLFEDQCMTILQGGSLNGNQILDTTFAFNEKRNSYCSFFELYPEWAVCANNKNYFWKKGQMYIQDDTGSNRKLFDTKFYPSITLVYNAHENIKKTYMALSYQANDLWLAETVGDILTSQPNSQTGMSQVSKLKDFNFDIQEGLYYAGLQRDINSRANPLDAWYNGDYLKGTWMQIKLTAQNNNNSYLYLPTLNWLPSPRN